MLCRLCLRIRQQSSGGGELMKCAPAIKGIPVGKMEDRTEVDPYVQRP